MRVSSAIAADLPLEPRIGTSRPRPAPGSPCDSVGVCGIAGDDSSLRVERDQPQALFLEPRRFGDREREDVPFCDRSAASESGSTTRTGVRAPSTTP